MNIWEIVVACVLIVSSIAIIMVVLLQQGRQANIGAINGAMDSFMEKGKAKTWDARLNKWTKIVSIAFFVLVLAGMLVTNFLGSSAG